MKLSIITVNYNNLQGLCRTFESVLSQSCQDVEHIIVDAASTDGSVDAVRDYEQKVASTPLQLNWVSEKDGGIYDGMNKAVRMATGDYLLFLNSGDLLTAPDVLREIFEADFSADIIIGSIRLCNGNHVQKEAHSAPDHLSLYTMYLQGVPHQASLIRRTLLLQLGGYDVRYRISADWAFFLKAIVLENCSVERVGITFCDYDTMGVSSTQTERLMAERTLIFREMLPQRIVEDYEMVIPHYYEVVRIQWLLRHPVCYKIYRIYMSCVRRLIK